MLHARNFEPLMSMRLDQDECDRSGGRDAARAPRGLILGLAVGAAMWLLGIVAFVTLT
ncbi:hypothetical protein HNO88_000695 [Novosphingobium chloroacetimidivorans]|uniref:Uncharacterized protein n=1 Tax=Novosphingobium chloroacetimidivorans TaxID=1428314 RepID=A0A7W7K8A3_9SPHN|nr:hypothetical protein [Novosphingobium chloroacetimidivorans]MBB4857388.1 hypothetical protein [Novosphingobium chloroacetimidivorans]